MIQTVKFEKFAVNSKWSQKLWRIKLQEELTQLRGDKMWGWGEILMLSSPSL